MRNRIRVCHTVVVSTVSFYTKFPRAIVRRASEPRTQVRGRVHGMRGGFGWARAAETRTVIWLTDVGQSDALLRRVQTTLSNSAGTFWSEFIPVAAERARYPTVFGRPVQSSKG